MFMYNLVRCCHSIIQWRRTSNCVMRAYCCRQACVAGKGMSAGLPAFAAAFARSFISATALASSYVVPPSTNTMTCGRGGQQAVRVDAGPCDTEGLPPTTAALECKRALAHADRVSFSLRHCSTKKY